MPVATPATRTQHRADYIRDAFSLADCWALADALCHRYQHLSLWALGFEGGGFCHVVARDDRNDTYIDIHGAHTEAALMCHWDDFVDDWDVLLPLSEVYALPLSGLERYYADVPVEEGIALLVGEGWEPPPLRA